MYARSTSKLSLRHEPDFSQYWLVHRARVDVPSMYRPHGRYKYAYGIVSPYGVDIFHISESFSQNWRAAAAMVVSVPPTFPGFLDSVMGNANTDAGAHLFNIAFILGVSIKLFEYLTHALTYGAVLSGITCLLHTVKALPSSRDCSRTCYHRIRTIAWR